MAGASLDGRWAKEVPNECGETSSVETWVKSQTIEAWPRLETEPNM
jgi:hypothetical protein